MVRLLEVLDFLEEEWKQADLSPAGLNALLENGRIQLDDEEDISLISLIQSDPKLKTWKSCVKEAVVDFDEQGEIFKGATTRSL
ncbi:MAG: hypothetical protein HRU09_07880 [Oligoflexales bacterium]|nr:hypothetical protein [Oligoflexales bacterium]